MFLSNARSSWNFLKLKTKIVVDKWTSKSRNVLPKSVEDDPDLQQDCSYSSGETSDTDAPPWLQLQPEVTISSQTEIGQTEESTEVPKQRAYTGRKPVISSSLADTPCSSLGIQGLLDLLNTTLATSYTLDTPSLSFVLEDCIAQEYDFGTAYGRLRSAWCDRTVTDIQMWLRKREAGDIDRRRDALDGGRIVYPQMRPRRVWDLYSNRVVPWWSCGASIQRFRKVLRPISHAWVDEVDRDSVWTPINGCEWPVPIPKGANLDLIRIEMLNLGLEYTWLDVLCLRQRGGSREDLRVEEWKLDVPTIGGIYQDVHVVCYLSGLGMPLSLKEGDLESDRCWFRRAWTLQEVGYTRMIAGDTPDGPMHAKPIDDTGNYKDEILTKFHKQLRVADNYDHLYDALSAMQDRISTYPVDTVAGLAFCLDTASIPAYYESQSLEDAWSALIDEMYPENRGILLFTYPEPGSACKKWRPSWEQVMTKSLPKNGSDSCFIAEARRGVDDLYHGLRIKRGYVRGLAVGGVEGSDRYGELVVEDVRGIARIFNISASRTHTFKIVASHQYPIPEDMYTLLCESAQYVGNRQHWVVGRLSNDKFEKMSVFQMTDLKEIERLNKLGLSVKSKFILA